MRDRRPLIALVVVLALLGAALYLRNSSSDSDAPATNASSSSTGAGTNKSGAKGSGADSTNATNPDGSPVTGASDSAGVTIAPQFKGTELEWSAAFGQILDLQNAILQSPKASRIDEYVDPSCPCYADIKKNLQTMENNKWRVKGNALELRASALTKQQGDRYSIAATFVGGNAPTVDSAGKVVEPPNTDQTNPILYVLKKKSSGTWVIVERRDLTEKK